MHVTCYTCVYYYLASEICTHIMHVQDMNQREVIYADVHVVTAESHKVEMVLDDDRIEYAELNHINIKTTTSMAVSRNSKKDEATTENLSNFMD